MERDKSLKEAMNKIALEYFLFGKEPSMDLNDDSQSSISSSSSSAKSFKNTSSRKHSNNNSKQLKPPKEDTTSLINKLPPKLPSKKKTIESNFEFEDSLPTGFIHISPKQQTSKYKDIQAKEVDESTVCF